MSNIKTNNVQELLKAKGISTKQNKTSASKLYDSAPAGTRIYNLEIPLPRPIEEPSTQNINAPLPALSIGETTQESSISIGVKSEDLDNESKKKSIRVNRGQAESAKTKDQLNQLGSTGVIESGSIGVNNRGQSGSTGVNNGQSGSKIGVNRGQTIPSVMELKVLLFIQNLRHGDALNKAQISQATGLKPEGVKTALRRLKSKEFIRLKDCSAGRYTGFTVYELTESAKEFLASGKAIEKIANWGHQSGSIGVSYSSSIINTNTTTEPEISIPPELQSMGVGMKALTSYLANMTTQEIQQSLDAFNYDLMHGLVKSSTPLNMLFGILKKGRTYLSSHFVEQLNRDVADAIKRSEEAEQKHKILEEANFKAKFYEWRLNNKQEADRLLTAAGLIVRGEKIAESFLMGEFRKLYEQETIILENT